MEGREEWEAWRALCEKLQKTFGITENEFNTRQDIKELCEVMGDWAYEFALLRESSKHPNLKPVFHTDKIKRR